MTSIYQRALDRWGAPSQVMMAQGECGEFIGEVTKFYLQGKSSLEALASEAADVSNMMEQMLLLLNLQHSDIKRSDVPPLPDNVNDAYKAMIVSKACAEFVQHSTEHFVERITDETKSVEAVSQLVVRMEQMRLIIGEALFDRLRAEKLARLEGIMNGTVSHPHQPKSD